MNCNQLYLAFIVCFFTNLIQAQDYYPLALNNKWSYEIYDDQELIAVSSLEIIDVLDISSTKTQYTMKGVETGIPDNLYYLIEKDEFPDMVFLSVDQDEDGVSELLNFLFHSYTVGDTVTILLSDYLVKDYGGYTTLKGLSFDNCLKLESIERDLDIILAPDLGIIAQYEVETPTLNMLELVEFKTGDEIISDVQSITSELSLDVYPNPASDLLIVKGPSELTNSEFKLYDIHGSVVYEDILSAKTVVNISDFPAGQYVLRVANKDGHVWLKKVVVF